MAQLIRTGAAFERTPAETANPGLFWERDDQAFFAAGACHVLAFEFRELYPEWQIVYLEPFGTQPGQHVYAADRRRYAFDHNGITGEMNLLTAINETYTMLYPGWCYSRLIIDCTLREFCQRYDHWLPEQFAHDPRPRARRYISTLV